MRARADGSSPELGDRAPHGQRSEGAAAQVVVDDPGVFGAQDGRVDDHGGRRPRAGQFVRFFGFGRGHVFRVAARGRVFARFRAARGRDFVFGFRLGGFGARTERDRFSARVEGADGRPGIDLRAFDRVAYGDPRKRGHFLEFGQVAGFDLRFEGVFSHAVFAFHGVVDAHEVGRDQPEGGGPRGFSSAAPPGGGGVADHDHVIGRADGQRFGVFARHVDVAAFGVAGVFRAEGRVFDGAAFGTVFDVDHAVVREAFGFFFFFAAGRCGDCEFLGVRSSSLTSGAAFDLRIRPLRAVRSRFPEAAACRLLRCSRCRGLWACPRNAPRSSRSRRCDLRPEQRARRDVGAVVGVEGAVHFIGGRPHDFLAVPAFVFLGFFGFAFFVVLSQFDGSGDWATGSRISKLLTNT